MEKEGTRESTRYGGLELVSRNPAPKPSRKKYRADLRIIGPGGEWRKQVPWRRASRPANHPEQVA